MAKRILLAGLLGGLVLFIWEFIAHVPLPLGEAGLRRLPNESSMRATLANNIKTHGMFMFPAPEIGPEMNAEQRKAAMSAAEAAMSSGPVGLLIYHPNGDPGLTPGRLGTQFGADVATMLLAAIVVSQLAASAGFGMRLGIVALLALVPALRTHIPTWNWYGFTRRYVAAQIVIDVVGLLAGGIIVAALVKGREKSMPARA